jgi:putative aldouronate transport system substrate-binding protein
LAACGGGGGGGGGGSGGGSPTEAQTQAQAQAAETKGEAQTEAEKQAEAQTEAAEQTTAKAAEAAKTEAQTEKAAEGAAASDPDALEYTQGVGNPVTLKVYMNDPNFNQSGWGTDVVSTEFIKRTGVDLEFEIAPDTDHQKLMLLIASEDLPDMVMTDKKNPPGLALIENEMIYSWDELMAQYAPKFAADQLITENRKYLEFENTGVIYSVPFDFTDRTKMDDGILIVQGVGYYYRQDLLEAIGNPPLVTLDDLESALDLVADFDPGLNRALMLWAPTSHDDASSAINVLYQSMGGRGKYWEDGDRLRARFRDPKYKQALLFVNRLYQKGYVNASDFTDQTPQQEVNNTAGGYFIAAGAYWRAIVAHEETPKAVPGADVQPLKALLQPGNAEYFSPSRVGNGYNGFLISKDTKYPDRCIWYNQFLNTSEALGLMSAGIENVHWEWGGPEKKFIVPINEGAELMAKGWTDWVNALGTYTYRWGAANYYDSAFAWGLGAADPFRLKLYEMTNCGKDYSEFDEIDPLDGTDESVIYVNYKEALMNAIARICLAGSEAEASAAYDEFFASMDTMGMPKVEQAWTERYAANNR